VTFCFISIIFSPASFYYTLCRSFDFEVETKSGVVHTFSSIEKDEYGKLFDFITSKKLRVKNRGKSVSWIRHSSCQSLISRNKNVQKRVYHWNIFQNNWNRNWDIESELVIEKWTGILTGSCFCYVRLLFIVNIKFFCQVSAISIFFWLPLLCHGKQRSLFCEVASKLI
jgi:hypothetical protein